MKGLICAAVVLGFTVSKGFTQSDTIVFLKGKTLVANVTGVSDAAVALDKYFNDKGKLIDKPMTIESLRVYSVTDNGKKTILYRQDSTIGNYLSPEQMSSFVKGEQHAHQYFNSKPHFYTGLGLGLAAVFVNSYDFGKGQFRNDLTFAPLLVIPVYAIGISLTSANLHTSQVSDKALLLDTNFLDGYDEVASSRKFWSGLKGISLGVAVGILGFYTLSNI